LVIRPDDMLIALCNARNKVYFSLGYKFLNMLNYETFDSPPSGIHSMSDVGSAILCQNDVYYLDGASEATIYSNHSLKEIGLEIGNWESIATNGELLFFQNEKGIYMITSAGLINITPPIDDYIYKRTSGNRIGIDSDNGDIYINLDPSKIEVLRTVLADTDYGVFGAETTNWNEYFGVFNYNEKTWRIYSYERSDTTTRDPFFGNLQGFVVVRVEDTLIIPEYRISDGTENPVARFETRRFSFGSYHTLNNLIRTLIYFINEGTYGVDYLKVMYNINDKTEYVLKYGDFHGTSYADLPGDNDDALLASYDETLRPTGFADNEGIVDVVLPANVDFRSLRIRLEFGRLRDTNYAEVSLIDLALDYSEKDRVRRGINGAG